MINCVIDGRTFKVEEGKTVLETALDVSIEIPTLCHHKQLSPYGACRLCLVEIVAGGRPGLQTACLYKVTEGLEVKTETERVKRTRKIILELLLARSPDSEAVKALAERYGVTETRIKLPVEGKCVLCGLCMRACAEISRRQAISVAYRGTKRIIETPFNKISERCIGCGACSYVCPTKAIEVEAVD